jgi:hypothetical protein
MSKIDPLFDFATFVIHHPDLDSILLPVLQGLCTVVRYLKEERWLQVASLIILFALLIIWLANYRYKKRKSIDRD